jgi:hypothetical protein
MIVPFFLRIIVNLFKRIKLLIVNFFHLGRVFFQILYGIWRISKLDMPIISIFGGHNFKLDDPYAQEAEKLSRMLAESNISVITGGGGGIMEAASKGASVKIRGVSSKIIGIGVKELDEFRSKYVTEYFELHYFFARKYLLTRYSIGFVVFPGGYGTMDEMFELLTLMQTKKTPKMPIVLIGTEFWNPLLNWMKSEWLKHKVINPKDLDLFYVTDDLVRAYSLVCATCVLHAKNEKKK